MSAKQIVDEIRQADLLLLRSSQDRLRVVSPSGTPLPEALRRRIVAHRRELLAWLAWNEWADEQLLAMTKQIAARYPPGCPLEGEEWRHGEQALDAAYRAHDSTTLSMAIGRYQQFAWDCFAAYRTQTEKRGRR